MRILVTGGGGFIGSRAAAYLARNGHDVLATCHSKTSGLRSRNLPSLDFAILDVTNRKLVGAMMDAGNFDAIVHAAAAIDTEDKLAALSNLIITNIGSVSNLVDAARNSGCQRFVFTSSIGVYGNGDSPEGGFTENIALPDTLYGWSKRTAEEVLDLSVARIPGFSAVSLRLAGVHGIDRNSGAIYAFARAAISNAPVKVAEPESRFRWSFIDDVLQGVERALTADISAGHHIVNLASADSFTLLELAEQICAAAESQSEIDVAASAQKRSAIMNINKAQQLFEFKPTPLEAFLPSYISSLRDQ